jgi:hypothetical protein
MNKQSWYYEHSSELPYNLETKTRKKQFKKKFGKIMRLKKEVLVGLDKMKQWRASSTKSKNFKGFQNFESKSKIHQNLNA